MIKTIFLRKGMVLLFLLVISLSPAQTINTAYKTQINAVFAGLDKTKIPHKLLINQAMEFAELTDYSGTLTTTNWTTRGKYTDVYNTLLMSRVQTAVPGLVSPAVFKTNWDNLREPNKIVLSGLYYKYNKFRPDCYPDYLTNNGGVITDKYVSGVWRNPYIDQQVFAVAAPILVYKSLSLQVTLPAALWYTNQSTSVQSIAVDFGDGSGYQNMTFGEIKTINYAAAGTFEWKYKLTLTDGQVLYNHSKLKIDIPVIETPPTSPGARGTATTQTTANACSNVVTVPFTGTRQYQGIANSATLQIKYSENNTDCKIHKPLIVVEGFDSGLLGKENPLGEVDYYSFIPKTYNSPNLYFELITYDIIYINFDKGRDDLKRNAYLVEDIIKYVNAEKATVGSTTPNVVIGQSMGGVIGRYALRDMEVLGQPHQTSLFVSHDAPHQGANIPLGVQYFARHLADQFVSTPVGTENINLADNAGTINIKDIQELLDSPGTKQLLSNYIDGSLNLNNSTFNAFQTELRNLGYPTQTRNIAISNGNHCAAPQEFNPGATLFSLNGSASTTALTTMLTTFIEPLRGISSPILAFEFNEPGLLLGMLPGSSNFAMNFSAKALPTAGTTGQVYKGRITYTKKIFSLFGWDPKVTVELTDKSKDNPSEVTLSYDYYPGGQYQLPFNFETTNINNQYINLGISAYMAPSFDFIPVPSALDIGGGSTPLSNSDYLRKYNSGIPPVAPYSAPYANFTTSFQPNSNLNEEHISFNARNGDWLAQEITNNSEIFDCSFVCSDTQQIAGEGFLCNSGVYSVPNLVAFYNWTITEGGTLVNFTGNGTNTINITLATPTSSGKVTLSVFLGNNNCGFRTLTKTIWIGKPKITIYQPPTSTCNTILQIRSAVTNATLQEQGITNVQWIRNGEELSGNNYSFGGTYEPILIKATNSCGTTILDSYVPLKLPVKCGVAPLRVANSNTPTVDTYYKIYPNPSSEIINIVHNDGQKVINTNSKAALYDLNGVQKKQIEILYNNATINVNDLPDGIYILKIYVDGIEETHQIIVN
ncbi:T9SS type A sorting domain-containing protein [Flavobacterium salmonis]|uniref:Uncharacterized protein n=1 Tax=Flavobacterium salmonis TaxID=2654844 RepID=A0A6V6YPI6_9FLAO|nr:T9SS type A sorting domain-containing protein [Flavobacterium salmonis]CAD0001289.1 hypothetical protein FLAT13_00477 [Flavobacterium salmonis]